MAEAAVVPRKDELNGAVPLGFLSLTPLAGVPRDVVMDRPPMTRSGKVLRSTTQKIGDEYTKNVFKQGVDQSRTRDPKSKQALKVPRDGIEAGEFLGGDKDAAAENLDKLKGELEEPEPEPDKDRVRRFWNRIQEVLPSKEDKT